MKPLHHVIVATRGVVREGDRCVCGEFSATKTITARPETRKVVFGYVQGERWTYRLCSDPPERPDA